MSTLDPLGETVEGIYVLYSKDVGYRYEEQHIPLGIKTTPNLHYSQKSTFMVYNQMDEIEREDQSQNFFSAPFPLSSTNPA